MNRNFLRLIALTFASESLYPVRKALARKLDSWGLGLGVPFDSLRADEPKSITCAIGHILQFIAQVRHPDDFPEVPPIRENDSDNRVQRIMQMRSVMKQTREIAADQVQLLQDFAATIGVELETEDQDEGEIPSWDEFEARQDQIEAVIDDAPAEVIEQVSEPVVIDKLAKEADFDSPIEQVTPDPEPEIEQEPETHAADLPIDSLEIDAKVLARLTSGLKSLDNPPSTLGELIQYASANDPTDLPGFGRTSWLRVQEAIRDLGLEI